jgi:hypothetical protein
MAERTQVHDPARGVEDQVESREETVERVLHDDARVREESGVEETGDVVGDPLAADVSTRRGLNLALALWFSAGAAIGGALGIALGYGLKEIVGPNPIGGVGDTFVFPLSLGLAFGLIGGLIGGYFELEAEDGRVERGVKEETDRPSDAPGEGPDPRSEPAGGLVNSDKLPVVLGVIGILGAFTAFAVVAASVAAIWTGTRLRTQARGDRSRSLGGLGIVTGVVGVVLVALLLVWGGTVF